MSEHQQNRGRKPNRGNRRHQNTRGQSAENTDEDQVSWSRSVNTDIGSFGNSPSTEQPRPTLEMPRGPRPPTYGQLHSLGARHEVLQSPSSPRSIPFGAAARNYDPQGVVTTFSPTELNHQLPQYQTPHHPTVSSTGQYDNMHGVPQTSAQTDTPEKGHDVQYVSSTGGGGNQRVARGGQGGTQQLSSRPVHHKVQKSRHNRGRGAKKHKKPAEEVVEEAAETGKIAGTRAVSVDHKSIETPRAEVLQSVPSPHATTAEQSSTDALQTVESIVKMFLAHNDKKHEREVQHSEAESQRTGQLIADATGQTASMSGHLMQLTDKISARSTDLVSQTVTGQAQSQIQRESDLKDVITQLTERPQIPQGYGDANRAADQAEIQRRGEAVWKELYGFWGNERILIGLRNIGQRFVSLCRAFMPLNDKGRQFDFLKQCEALACRLNEFSTFLESHGQHLDSHLMKLGWDAHNTISTTCSPEAARDALSVFGRESDAVRLSKDIPRIVQKFDAEVRQAYIQMWPFVEEGVNTQLFTDGWSSVRSVLADLFHCNTSLMLTFTNVTTGELDKAKREVLLPSEQLLKQFEVHGITDTEDPRFLQAVTLRNGIVPQVSEDGRLEFGSFDLALLFAAPYTGPTLGSVSEQRIQIEATPAQQLRIEEAPAGFVEDRIVEEEVDEDEVGRFEIEEIEEGGDGDGDIEMS